MAPGLAFVSRREIDGGRVVPLRQHARRRRDGDEYELGVTLTANPWRRWFAFVDYRVVIDTATNGAAKALLMHMLLLRLEVRALVI